MSNSSLFLSREVYIENKMVYDLFLYGKQMPGFVVNHICILKVMLFPGISNIVH
jgi:hypothetical protein